MSQRLEKRVQVYMDSGHIRTRRSPTDFDYVLDESIILKDDEAVTVKLGYLSLKHDFRTEHTHIKINEKNDSIIIKHGNWAHSYNFPFRLDNNVDHLDHDITDPNTSTITQTIKIKHDSYLIPALCKTIKDAIEKEMTYASFRYNDGYKGHPTTPHLIEMHRGQVGSDGSTTSDLKKDVGVESTLFWCPTGWIYDSFYRVSMGGGSYTHTQLLTLYQLVFHTVFKTNATVTFDNSTEKFNIAIAAELPDVSWSGASWSSHEVQYPFLKDFRFRTLVLMPGSTLLTSIGYTIPPWPLSQPLLISCTLIMCMVKTIQDSMLSLLTFIIIMSDMMELIFIT